MTHRSLDFFRGCSSWRKANKKVLSANIANLTYCVSHCPRMRESVMNLGDIIRMSRYGVNFHATLVPSNCVAQTQDAPSLSRPDWTIGGGFKLAAELPFLVHCVVRGKRVSDRKPPGDVETAISTSSEARVPQLSRRRSRFKQAFLQTQLQISR